MDRLCYYRIAALRSTSRAWRLRAAYMRPQGDAQCPGWRRWVAGRRRGRAHTRRLCPAPHIKPERLACEQAAFGVHPMQDGLEALALGADDRIGAYPVVVEEDLVGVDRATAHLLDLAHVEPRRGPVQIDTE